MLYHDRFEGMVVSKLEEGRVRTKPLQLNFIVAPTGTPGTERHESRAGSAVSTDNTDTLTMWIHHLVISTDANSVVLLCS